MAPVGGARLSDAPKQMKDPFYVGRTPALSFVKLKAQEAAVSDIAQFHSNRLRECLREPRTEVIPRNITAVYGADILKA